MEEQEQQESSGEEVRPAWHPSPIATLPFGLVAVVDDVDLPAHVLVIVAL